MRAELRPYQSEILHGIRDALGRGNRRILVVAPTGSGKTHIIAYLAHVYASTHDVAVIAHRREILAQTAKAVGECRVALSTINAAFRGKLRAGVLLLDEAHLATSMMWSALIERLPEALVFGFTATPYRLDGVGLGAVFQEIVAGPQVKDLIALGNLVPARTFAPTVPDLSGIKTIGGDWAQNGLAVAMRHPKITGDIVEHYKRLGAPRQAIVFAVNIEHSREIAEAFQAASIPCAHVDGQMTPTRRDRIVADFREGDVKVLTSCNILSEGLDVPGVGCIILARPTKSETLYRQQIGRGSRATPGKQDFLIIDHAGNALRHGLFADEKTHTLEGRKRKARDAAKPVRQCLKCYAVYEGTTCPACGDVQVPKRRHTREVAGQLVELLDDGSMPAGWYKRVLAAIWSSPSAEWRKRLSEMSREMKYHPSWVDRMMGTKNRRWMIARPGTVSKQWYLRGKR